MESVIFKSLSATIFSISLLLYSVQKFPPNSSQVSSIKRDKEKYVKLWNDNIFKEIQM